MIVMTLSLIFIEVSVHYMVMVLDILTFSLVVVKIFIWHLDLIVPCNYYKVSLLEERDVILALISMIFLSYIIYQLL